MVELYENIQHVQHGAKENFEVTFPQIDDINNIF